MHWSCNLIFYTFCRGGGATGAADPPCPHGAGQHGGHLLPFFVRSMSSARIPICVIIVWNDLCNVIILPWVLCLVPRVYVMQLLSREVSKVSDSTGNLIARIEVRRSIRHPLWFYLFSFRVCTVASGVNVWKPSLFANSGALLSKVLRWHSSALQLVHISNLYVQINRKVRIITLVQIPHSKQAKRGGTRP